MPDAAAWCRSVREWRSIARVALSEYGIADARLSFLAGGKHPAFRVRLPGRSTRAPPDDRYLDQTFLLRIFSEGARTSAVIRSELRWIESILADTSIVVPKPVRGNNGDLVVRAALPGEGHLYHGTLTHWVKGRIFLRATGPGPRQLRLVGQTMARLHLHGRQFRRDAGFCCPVWDGDGLFGERSPYFPDAERGVLQPADRRLYSRVAHECLAAMDQLGTEQDVFGLVHGDLIQLNYLFHKGEVRIIDFGDFGCAHYLYDMAVTLFALLDLDQNGLQRRAFLEGYREVRDFSDQHEELLNLFLAARGVLLARFVMGSSEGRLSEGGTRYVTRVTNGIRCWMSGS